MNLNIVCIPGDGIGPEVVAEAKKVLDKVASKYNHTISYKDILMGGGFLVTEFVPDYVPRFKNSFHLRNRICHLVSNSSGAQNSYFMVHNSVIKLVVNANLRNYLPYDKKTSM